MSSFAAPPPGTNYLAVIEPGLTFSLLGAFFGGLLIPLFIFLFIFTNPASRRHPVFILNVAIVILGLTFAALNVGEQWKSMVTPESPPTDSLIYANIVISVLSPLVIDSVLLFRLLAFYPVMTTPRITFLKVLAFPILVKCGRLASVTLFLHQMNQTSGQNSIGVLAEKLWFRNHYMISEWSLQMADNLYSTSLLLWKLRKFYRGGEQGFRLQSKTLVSRLRGIFVIALANFVFPLFMNVTQLVLIIQDTDYAHGTEVLFGNFYISIIGILFATVWASRHAWGHNDRDRDEDLSTFQSSSMPGYVMSNASAHARVSDRHGSRGPQLNIASQHDRSRSYQSSQDGFKE